MRSVETLVSSKLMRAALTSRVNLYNLTPPRDVFTWRYPSQPRWSWWRTKSWLGWQRFWLWRVSSCTTSVHGKVGILYLEPSRPILRSQTQNDPAAWHGLSNQTVLRRLYIISTSNTFCSIEMNKTKDFWNKQTITIGHTDNAMRCKVSN